MEYNKWYAIENPTEIVIRDSDCRTIARTNKLHPTSEANARLIAQAPRLYEACKAGAMWIEEGEDTSAEGIKAILEYMNKAIAEVEKK